MPSAFRFCLGFFGSQALYLMMADDPDTQDPHRIVRCASAPDMLWTQHHCGIYRSTDNGTTWSNLGQFQWNYRHYVRSAAAVCHGDYLVVATFDLTEDVASHN